MSVIRLATRRVNRAVSRSAHQRLWAEENSIISVTETKLPTALAGTGSLAKILAADADGNRLRSAGIHMAVTGFGFDVPDNATILGIEPFVTINFIQANAAIDLYVDKTVNAQGGVPQRLPTSVGLATMGGPTSLFGQTWTPSDIKSSTFGLTFLNTEDVGNNFIDLTECRVHFSIPA